MIPSGDTNEDENRSGVLLERLSFDQTIGRVFSIWCQGLSVFTVLSSLFFVLPSFFIAFVLQPILLGWKGLDPDKMASDPNYALQHMGDLLVLGYMKTIPIVVFAWLFAAMVTHGVGTIYLGREIRTKETFQGGLQRALPYLLAVLLSYVIVILGYGKFRVRVSLLIFFWVCLLTSIL